MAGLKRSQGKFAKAFAFVCILALSGSAGFAQYPQAAAPAGEQAAGPSLSPDQLDNLVAPIALYPDPLLSQALVAATYPLEVVEAGQWLQQNSGLQGRQLMDAAKRQNWDPSVQALIAFPEALQVLANDARWATDLGNAFLAQQADVMNAIQRMRLRARANGTLGDTPQQVVTGDEENGQSAIEIQPADPGVGYVPAYNPYYAFGAPQWGDYPDLWYPDYGFGFGFGPPVYLGAFFPGWLGWGGWGWGCGWLHHGLFLNAGFFNRYGFRERFGGFGARGFNGRAVWNHDPTHRGGVPYGNRAVAARFHSSELRAGASAGGWQRFNGANRVASSGSPGSYGGNSLPRAGAHPEGSYRGSTYSGRGYGNAAVSRGFVGNGSPSYGRSYSPGYSRTDSAPRGSSAPRSYGTSRSYSAPSGGGGHFSGGGGGHAGGGGRSGGGRR